MSYITMIYTEKRKKRNKNLTRIEVFIFKIFVEIFKTNFFRTIHMLTCISCCRKTEEYKSNCMHIKKILR